ncbi:MAG: ATP synthase F1 subunit gamma [Chloroflexi bacterium]|nr:ATP synthase F1 subunit gamma [Chloroflexota bacterium]
MPSERELRRRVRSVKNIQQVTQAMQLVAASRMRRAQAAVLASRPYEDRLRTVLHELAPFADPEVSPLLAQREVRRVGVVAITSDRGLVGALNVNVIRMALRFAQRHEGASFIAVGRKAVSAIRRLRLPLLAEFSGLGDRPTTVETGPISRIARDEFVGGGIDEVHLVFPRFVNTLRQVPTTLRILPFRIEPDTAGGPRGAEPPGRLQYLFEPDPETVLNVVLPRLIEVSVYQAVLEAKASEQSARMVAMRNATDAAADLIDEITLAANKARQTRITKEMLEIASGAEALSKG